MRELISDAEVCVCALNHIFSAGHGQKRADACSVSVHHAQSRADVADMHSLDDSSTSLLFFLMLKPARHTCISSIECVANLPLKIDNAAHGSVLKAANAITK